MKADDYLKDSARTNRRKDDGKDLSAMQIECLHGAMGASTEANELLDMMKKNIFYGKDIDVVNIVEEVGDILWYCALLLRECGYTFEEVMEINIEKLRLRFPEKFEEDQAINRDVDKERTLLESEAKVKRSLKSDDVSADVWRDFKKMRDAKKAPLTETALKGLKREADKAGKTLEWVMKECVTRGWRGFKADWVTGKGKPAPENFEGNDYGSGGKL